MPPAPAIEPTRGDLPPTAPAAMPDVVVWDPLVRILHGGLIVLFTAAFISGDDHPRMHLWSGYGVLAIVVVRLVWGIVGRGHARFGDFVAAPGRIVTYARNMARGKPPRYLGHNPLGGLMVLALLALLLVISATGIALTIEPYKRWEAVEEAHEIASNAALALVALHVAGVLVASYQHGENLIRAMITGRKRQL